MMVPRDVLTANRPIPRDDQGSIARIQKRIRECEPLETRPFRLLRQYKRKCLDFLLQFYAGGRKQELGRESKGLSVKGRRFKVGVPESRSIRATQRGVARAGQWAVPRP
jgi:hypothetical protein